MRKFLLSALFAALSITASAAPRYILRYTESEPLPTFLARYGLVREASVPNRPIHAVRDPRRRPAADLIRQIEDDTDDDVGIEPDQRLRLPILALRTPQRGGLPDLLAMMRRNQPVAFYGGIAIRGALEQAPIGLIRASASWRTHGLGSGTVAVIDTGVDGRHPFFGGRVLQGIDLLTAGGNGSELNGLPPELRLLLNPTTTPLLQQPTYLSSGHAPFLEPQVLADPRWAQVPVALGHGTMVAGAVRLVAPNARILPIRAFAQNGVGSLFHVIWSIHAAEQRGAKVVNLSLNTLVYSAELERTAQEVSDRGVMLIASTGNDGRIGVPSYPAALPKVTGVASVNRGLSRSAFSNAGVDLTWVSAPGEALLLPFPGGRWAGGWGTSFAAPLVSGLGSKLLLRKPDATYSDLQSVLGLSAPLADPNLGKGLLDVWSSTNGL